MFDAQWELKGYDNAIKKMRDLPVKIRAKAGRSALGRAVRIVTNAAKDNAKRIDDAETGRTIAANVVQRFRSKFFKQTGDLMISVGVATNKGPIPKGNPDEGPKGNTPHWHLIERGTEKAKAQPFMLPALVQNIDAVEAKFAVELEKQIDKIVKTNT